MLERGKINSLQAFFLMVTLISPEGLIYLPAISVNAAKQDAWLSGATATLAALPIALLVAGLSLRFPGKNLFEYPELILGKVPGKIIAFLYVLWFIHMETFVFGEFGNFVVTSELPGTPMVVTYIVAALVAAYIARNGLEVLSRFNQLFLPLFLISIFAVIALVTKDLKVIRLLPVYDGGLVPILKGTAPPVSWMGEIVFLAVFIPYLNKPRQAVKVAITATLLNGSLITVAILFPLSLYCPDLAASFLYPTYNAARAISITNFLERLESVFAVLWTIGGFIKVGLLRYAAVLGAAQCLGLRDYRPLALPVGAIVVAGSLLMNQNVTENIAFGAKTWPFYGLTFEMVVPFLLLVVALVRGLGKRTEDQHKQ